MDTWSIDLPLKSVSTYSRTYIYIYIYIFYNIHFTSDANIICSTLIVSGLFIRFVSSILLLSSIILPLYMIEHFGSYGCRRGLLVLGFSLYLHRVLFLNGLGLRAENSLDHVNEIRIQRESNAVWKIIESKKRNGKREEKGKIMAGLKVQRNSYVSCAQGSIHGMNYLSNRVFFFIFHYESDRETKKKKKKG